MDLKQAYEVMGVGEDANKDQIYKRYDVLLKKLRNELQSGLSQDEYNARLEELNQAYNLLMGYDTSDIPEEFHENKLLSKIGISKDKQKKLKNFLYYYKYIILVSLFIIISLTLTVRSIVTRVKPDLNIAFIGSIFCTDEEALAQKIKDNFPVPVEPGIDGAFISGPNDPNAPTMMNKIMVLLAAADTDLVVLDKHYFELYAKQGAFESLEPIADQLGIDREKNKDFILESNDNPGQELLYGVDVSDSDLFGPPEVIGEEKIAAISVRVKNREKTIELLKLLLNSAEQQDS